MFARQVRIGLLVEFLGWTAIGAWLRASAGWSLAGVLVLAAGVILGARLAILLVTFAMSWRNRAPLDPGHRAGAVGFVSLAAREWLWMLANNLYWLPFETRALRPDPDPAPGGPMPVVIVHGYVSNRGTVRCLARALDAAGAGPVFVPSLPAVFAPIETFADHLSATIERICQATGHARVILVGHSMGGLVSRAYLARRGNAHVARLVTLGSPHHGTAIAPLGLGANAAQMRIGSDFLAGLEKSEGESGPTS
jgi:triacylglycerol esterase/lipase EstA (alpha/beta hydrolase family)